MSRILKTVYLAGPIAGCTDGEANDWRRLIIEQLRPYGVIGISPLRCEPLHGKTYASAVDFLPDAKRERVDERFGTARAIASKNKFDVHTCDMGLFYLPRALNEKRPSYGTVIELAWTSMIQKPTILVTDDPNVSSHPVVGACASWILPTLDEAVDVITGILGDYAAFN